MKNLAYKNYFRKIAFVLLAAAVAAAFCSCAVSEIDRVSRDLSSYTIEAVYDEENHRLYANQKLNYINNEELPLSELCFHLYANAYRQGATIRPINNQGLSKAYPNGMSYGGIEIMKVCVNDVEVTHSVGGTDMDILVVPLSDELYPGEKLTVDIEFTLTLPNVLHRLGYGDKFVNFGNWYPILCVYEEGNYKKTPYYSNGDPFYSDCANYEVTVTAPEGYKGAFTGRAQSKTENGKTVYSVKAKAVRDFAFVLSKNFKVATVRAEDVDIFYYYYDDPDFEASLQIARESLETFNSLFGKYKYDILSVVQTGFAHLGMEYPTLVYISDTANAESRKETIVHEIAHQWWYAAVGSNQAECAWLDEGLAEYSTVLFYEQNTKYNITREQLIESTLNSYKVFVDIYKQIMGTTDTSMNRPVNEFASETEYLYMTYLKGELMFEYLRKSIGDEKFFKGLKKYYKENAFCHATPQSFIYSMERGSGIKLEGFITSWIEGDVVL